MLRFTNTTTKDQYETFKRDPYFGVMFEYVPNTATGYEDTWKHITIAGHKYLLSANTERDYFLHCLDNNFCVYFRTDGDSIEIKKASMGRRSEQAARYLTKYQNIVTMMHSIIKYDGIVRFKEYRG